jgi:hypothetical protein
VSLGCICLTSPILHSPCTFSCKPTHFIGFQCFPCTVDINMPKVKCICVKLKGFVQDFGEQYFSTDG